MSETPKLTPEERAEAAILHERLSEDGDELERFIYSAVFIRARLERELAAERERADRNQEDAGRWIRLCELWGASTELALMQEDDGRWSIKQVEDVEGETFYQLFGDTPDAAIDAARGRK